MQVSMKNRINFFVPGLTVELLSCLMESGRTPEKRFWERWEPTVHRN